MRERSGEVSRRVRRAEQRKRVEEGTNLLVIVVHLLPLGTEELSEVTYTEQTTMVRARVRSVSQPSRVSTRPISRVALSHRVGVGGRTEGGIGVLLLDGGTVVLREEHVGGKGTLGSVLVLGSLLLSIGLCFDG